MTITLASHSYWKLEVAPMLAFGRLIQEQSMVGLELSVLLETRTLLLRVESKSKAQAPPVC